MRESGFELSQDVSVEERLKSQDWMKGCVWREEVQEGPGARTMLRCRGDAAYQPEGLKMSAQ